MKKALFYILLVLFGCSQNEKTINGKRRIVKNTNNDIKAIGADIELISNSKTIDGITYTVNKIAPADVKEILGSRFDGESDYSDFSCFFMDITIQNERDIANYKSDLYQNLDERVQYLSFMIKDFISIKSNIKEYSCLNSTFDRSYGQLPYSRFFLVFNKIDESDVIFQFDDNYFNRGRINLKL